MIFEDQETPGGKLSAEGLEAPTLFQPTPHQDIHHNHKETPDMSSGYGLNGGVSRCFPFWQEVLACYVVNTNSEDVTGKKKCAPVLEDYYECLHHKKEHARVSALQEAWRRKAAAHPRDNGFKAEQVRNLGLLGKEEDTKKVLGIK